MPSAKAAVLRRTGAPMTIETIEVEPLAPDDALVRVRAASLCHTDLVVRPGDQVIWLGKVRVQQEEAFRWGSLMQEKRITRSSYGGARPQQDFPLLARAYLEGRLKLDEMISARIDLVAINDGFAALKRAETVRSVVMFT